MVDESTEQISQPDPEKAKRPYTKTPKLIRDYRNELGYRARIAQSLGVRYPALYLWWQQVAPQEAQALETDEGIPAAVRERTVQGLAHLAGVPWWQVQSYVSAFESMIDRAMVDAGIRAVLEGDQAREARRKAKKRAGRVARAGDGTRPVRVTVETTGGAVSNDRTAVVGLNQWDAESMGPVLG